jgi:hypothetical protein
MGIIGRVFLGLLFAGVGFVFVKYAHWFYANIGPIDWAEKYFSTAGGTRAFYKLLGILFIFVGALVATGLAGAFFSWALSPLMRGKV